MKLELNQERIGLDHRSYYGWIRPKVIVGRILPNDLILKTQRLLVEHGTIPLIHFPSIFTHHYNQIFDASALGFDNGVKGFFDEIEDIVELTSSERGLSCSLKTNRKQRNGIIYNNLHEKTIAYKRTWSYVSFVREAHLRRRTKNLFADSNQNSLLWYRFEHLLERGIKSIMIAPSPLEMAYQRNPDRVRYEVDKIHRTLLQFPEGLPLTEIVTKIVIDKRLFNAQNIDSITIEYPELFYRVEPESDCDEPIIFDGMTQSHDDLSGSDIGDHGIEPLRIGFMAVTSGIYQKTILLILKSGGEGLKLAVWRQSIKHNFERERQVRYENIIFDMMPLNFFLALASLNLIEIRHHSNSRNDLRLHLPTRTIDFREFMKISHDMYHSDEEDSSVGSSL